MLRLWLCHDLLQRPGRLPLDLIDLDCVGEILQLLHQVLKSSVAHYHYLRLAPAGHTEKFGLLAACF